MAFGNRSMAGRLVKGAAKKAWTRFMDRVGGKLVAGFADTSSDAPDAHYQPKRDLYSRMQADAKESATPDPESGG